MPEKVLTQSAGALIEKSVGTIVSAGAGDTGKLVALDAAGRIDTTVLPTGIGPNVSTITTSEALAANDYVNIWSSTGSKARKADASTAGKEAHGYVLAAAASGAAATVYFSGLNTGLTGLTPGNVYLSATTPGAATSTPPSASGQSVQRVGVAVSATAINTEIDQPIVLA